MLEVQGLRKQYGELLAVRNLSFTLKPGDVFGFIGSNGAGKTTTIRMLATLLEPTAGTATLNGIDLLRDSMEMRGRIGYMPDFFGLYDDVKVWEYLDFFATLYHVPSPKRAQIVEDVLHQTNLTVKRDDFVQSLSRGMQQRLCLARCLVHDPELLLLDEPASGLDPRARSELKDLILNLGRAGKIVIVSSHILPELSEFCNTVGILERGELLAFGPVDEVMRGIHPSRSIQVRFLDSPEPGLRFLEGRPGVGNAAIVADGVIRFELQGTSEAQADLLAVIVRENLRVISFQEVAMDLEDVFLKLTTGAVQ